MPFHPYVLGSHSDPATVPLSHAVDLGLVLVLSGVLAWHALIVLLGFLGLTQASGQLPWSLSPCLDHSISHGWDKTWKYLTTSEKLGSSTLGLWLNCPSCLVSRCPPGPRWWQSPRTHVACCALQPQVEPSWALPLGLASSSELWLSVYSSETLSCL